uniref:Uncharacterized protein n=1 Tax=uncultured Bacteroidota bacterium TaxID=152509 RepID=H5SIF7_9BACT|nr:hypothetical protein HGMM_F32H02C16 [uncultured Bacteroidetes bacterium]
MNSHSLERLGYDKEAIPTLHTARTCYKEGFLPTLPPAYLDSAFPC